MVRPDQGPPEIDRVVRRWQQLPAHHASLSADLVRSLIDDFAHDIAEASGEPAESVPDLGPAVVMDQLTVLAYDARLAGVPDVDDRLAALRRALA